MVQITSLLLVATAGLLGSVSAQQHHPSGAPTCNVNELYCGGELLANYAVWQPRVDAALVAAGKPTLPGAGTLAYDATFNCTSPTTVSYVEWCKDNNQNNRLCHPPSHDSCKTRVGGVLIEQNSCCSVN